LKTHPHRLTRVEALHALADGAMIVTLPNGMCPIRFGVDGFERWTPTIAGWAPVEMSVFSRYRQDFYLFVEQNPYRRGTFSWAEWVFGRGKSVARRAWPDLVYTPDPIDKHAFESFLFRAEDFHADDWHVPGEDDDHGSVDAAF
jgi:hypothetical protein